MKNLYSLFLLMILSIATFGQGLEEYVKKYQELMGCKSGDSAKVQALISFYKNCLQNDSTNHILFHSVALNYLQLKLYDSAKIYAQKSLQLKKDDPMIYVLLARTFFYNQNYDSAAFYYDLASKYETDIAQKKKYKFNVVNKYIKEEKFTEARKHTQEILAIDSLDLIATYYYIKLSNKIEFYKESKEKVLASLQSFDFENKYKDQKAKFLLELLIALFELNDMENFEKY